MKILFVVPYVPSLIRVRSLNLIRALSGRGHQVYLLTLWSTRSELAELEPLKQCCDQVQAIHISRWRSILNCLWALPGTIPLQAVYSWAPDLLPKIAALLPQVDVVHAEHLRGASYGIYAQSSHQTFRTPVVWDSVDCISHLFEQSTNTRSDRLGKALNRLELIRTRRHESWLLQQFDRVLVTSPVDKQAMLGLNKSATKDKGQDSKHRVDSPHIEVLPNGVDLEYFTPADELRDPKTLVFTGKMSYHANVTAVEHLVKDIMPAIWSRQSDVQLIIVGKEPPAKLQSIAARHFNKITITGSVPDIRPYLRRASVAVVPLVYGAGCQNKVLEAMACATPVVATPKAVLALNAQPGRNVLVALGTAAFAGAALDLLTNPEKRRRIGEAGRQYVEHHHRWDQIAAQLEGIYEDVIRSNRRTNSSIRLVSIQNSRPLRTHQPTGLRIVAPDAI